uniref:Phytanoyl-CoA dioxygenase n=1 Tax=Acrobeloides nanus TaxID=290746 RepID=A0A914CWH3_9BILA
MPEKQPIYIDAEELSAHRDGAYALNGVLDSTEIAHLQNQMWNYLERLTNNHKVPIRQNHPKTWKSIGDLESLQKMLFQTGSIGHNPMSWHVRTSEKVLKEFQELHQTDRLLTSMDGMSIMLPPEKTGFGFQDQSGRVKLHTDQAYRDSTINCWQGQVNLFNVYENDGALRLLRGSHKLHEEFPKHFNQIDLNKSFFILNKEELQWYRDRLDDDADVCVKTEAGSLLLWTSCTIHQGMNPTRPRPHPENIRCTLYVCMHPFDKWSSKQIQTAQRAFHEHRTTDGSGTNLFGKYHPTSRWGKSFHVPPNLTRTELGIDEKVILEKFPFLGRTCSCVDYKCLCE